MQKDYAALVQAIETALKDAHANGQFLAFKEVFDIPSVAEHATGLQQVKDVIATMREKGCTISRAVDAKEHQGGRVGYAWKADAVFTITSPGKPRKTPQKAAKQAAEASPAPASAPNEVELCINGINLVAGINPATGRIRITIG